VLHDGEVSPASRTRQQRWRGAPVGEVTRVFGGLDLAAEYGRLCSPDSYRNEEWDSRPAGVRCAAPRWSPATGPPPHRLRRPLPPRVCVKGQRAVRVRSHVSLSSGSWFGTMWICQKMSFVFGICILICAQN
jgi:hypothetical protein